MPDTLNLDLRHTIRICWKTLGGQQAIKSVAIDLDLAGVLPDEFSPKRQITNTWACGSSASRLCEILVGNPLADYLTNPDAIPLSNTIRVAAALQAMRNTTGRFLVRINICEGEAGHSYIFLSQYRTGREPLTGMIYQTNVGCHMDSAFDLIHWIDDPKSYLVVDLKDHLNELSRDLSGLAAPDEAYQKNFMLSSKVLTSAEIAALTNPGKPARIIFQWSPIDPAVASRNLERLRAQSTQSVRWPKVSTNPKAFRSHG